MGIVFNTKTGGRYKSESPSAVSSSHQRPLEALTRQNLKFLKSLGLRLQKERRKKRKPIIFDESIAHYEIHAHQPFGSTTFNNNDEIRIAVQHQDLCLLPSKSALHVHGRLTKTDGGAVTHTRLVNCAILHLFEEIRYELNAVVIDRNKNIGITTLMKNYVSQTPGQAALLENAGWILKDDERTILDASGYFDISIPLIMLLGFPENYARIIVNAKHELILTRGNTDVNAVVQAPVGEAAAESFRLSLTKVEWMIPYIRVADSKKISLLNYISKDAPIPISFRAWESYEYPLLLATSKHVWVVKCSTQLEKPRYVIMGFQTNRKNQANKNASRFDHCNIRDVKLFLNSQSYPYGNLNLDFDHNQYALLYDMYTSFQSSYYGKETEPLLSKTDFLTYAPLIVIDCSKQNEYLKSGPVDIRLEFESDHNFPFKLQPIA
ncbi:uncharacterized protein LOC107040742 [Diachasma alloeum]|uniref:uncharacterized protein LOC107040742 n=1 Tax=Diachasma alloeum TaxID=454923 RepID=UPI0007381578|nr:uncharacterized protein LOC107040742 [Diachasma alloeum]